MAVWRSFAVTTSYSSHKVQYSCCVMTESSSTIKILGFIKTRSPTSVVCCAKLVPSKDPRLFTQEEVQVFTRDDSKGQQASTFGNTLVRVHPCPVCGHGQTRTLTVS